MEQLYISYLINLILLSNFIQMTKDEIKRCEK